MFSKQHKTEGIILRRAHFKEADLILTVFTKEQGKIDCIAKGARRMNSRFLGRLEPLCQVTLAFFEGKNMSTLNEVEVIALDNPWGKTVEHDGVAFFITEITQKLLPMGQSVPEVYELFSEAISLLADLPYKKTAECHPLPEKLMHAYCIKLLGMLGFLPSWRNCGRCGKPLELKESLIFNSERTAPHGLCCSSYEKGMTLNPLFVKIVHFTQSQPLDAILRVNLDELRVALWDWIQSILNAILGQRVRSIVFLEMTLGSRMEKGLQNR